MNVKPEISNYMNAQYVLNIFVTSIILNMNVRIRKMTNRHISEGDREYYYELIGEVYFKEHVEDFDEIHKKLEDVRNRFALKYGYDRSNHGIDVSTGEIVTLYP